MTDERITAYLLNELSEREAEQFEDECFAQREWPEEELESAEQDLIQAYVKNELSAEQRRRFEEHYLTTGAREERLLIARSFLRVACSGATEPQPTWWQRIMAFLKPEPASLRAFVPRLAGVVLAIGLTVVLAFLILRPRAPQTFASLSLVSTTDTRSDNRFPGGPVKKLTLPLAADAVRISLQLTDRAPESSTYRVQWEGIKGAIENLAVESAASNTLTVVIPAEKLKPGQYTLKLYRKNTDGTEERVPGNYHFDVEKKP